MAHIVTIARVLQVSTLAQTAALVAMAGQRFGKQTITLEMTIFHKATLEKLQPIFLNIFVLLKKNMDICSVIKKT